MQVTNITLLPEHEQFIQARLQSGQYQSINELFSQAIALLIESEEEDLIQDPTWVESTRTKVTQAIGSIKTNGGTDGDTAMAKLLDRYQQSAQQI
jgi:antitoxin ParD1/3/4